MTVDIVDPTNDNIAIDHNTGEVLNAIRILPALKNPSAPTVSELNAAGSIIGYGKFTWDV